MKFTLIIVTSILDAIAAISITPKKVDIFVSPGNSYTKIGGTTYGSDGSY